MCTWSRQRAVRLRSEALMLGLRVDMGEPSLKVRSESMVDTRRATLKWWRGSRRMTAASWPLRSVVELNEEGRMAWAMLR